MTWSPAPSSVRRYRVRCVFAERSRQKLCERDGTETMRGRRRPYIILSINVRTPSVHCSEILYGRHPPIIVRILFFPNRSIGGGFSLDSGFQGVRGVCTELWAQPWRAPMPPPPLAGTRNPSPTAPITRSRRGEAKSGSQRGSPVVPANFALPVHHAGTPPCATLKSSLGRSSIGVAKFASHR